VCSSDLRESAEPPAEFLEAIRKGERRALARAITLLESSRDDLAEQAQAEGQT